MVTEASITQQAAIALLDLQAREVRIRDRIGENANVWSSI